MGEKLSSIELVQTFLHLLAKPCVMINVVFHQLLDVFLRTPVVLGSDTVEFRFQVRMEVYLHICQYEQVDLALSTGRGMPEQLCRGYFRVATIHPWANGPGHQWSCFPEGPSPMPFAKIEQ